LGWWFIDGALGWGIQIGTIINLLSFHSVSVAVKTVGVADQLIDSIPTRTVQML
jgi:hypothetical protein